MRPPGSLQEIRRMLQASPLVKVWMTPCQPRMVQSLWVVLILRTNVSCPIFILFYPIFGIQLKPKLFWPTAMWQLTLLDAWDRSIRYSSRQFITRGCRSLRLGAGSFWVCRWARFFLNISASFKTKQPNQLDFWLDFGVDYEGWEARVLGMPIKSFLKMLEQPWTTCVTWDSTRRRGFAILSDLYWCAAPFASDVGCWELSCKRIQ